MKIEALPDAVEFITEHGGELYVWSDEAGFDHASTSRPEGNMEFDEHHADGFTFFQDRSIGSPDWWKVEFHHLPHRHVTALWEGGLYGAPALF